MSGEGPAVVLLHGWTLDRRMWRPQLAALSAAYCVAAIDRRGFGESTAPPDLDRESDDVLAVLDALGVARCALVGMSQGGRVALRFAHRHPERTWGLVLQGAPLDGFAPGPNAEDAIPLDDYRSLVRAGRIAAMRAAWRGHPLMRLLGDVDRSGLDAMVEAYDGRDLAEDAAAPAAAPNLARALHAIPAPALVVTGERDTPWLRLVGDALAYGLPTAERLEIAGAGHLCNMSHPAAFNAALLGFLGRRADRAD